MLSHDLARALLSAPNLPVATHALGHTYMSKTDAGSHGTLKVGVLESYGGQHVVIGDISRRMINAPNWWVSEMLLGVAPDNWEPYEPYAGLTTGDVRFWAKDDMRLKLHSDGIDRYSTGRIGVRSAVVDARGGPPEPQFGGHWCGRMWEGEEKIADTGYAHDTFDAALAALNAAITSRGLEVYR